MSGQDTWILSPPRARPPSRPLQEQFPGAAQMYFGCGAGRLGGPRLAVIRSGSFVGAASKAFGRGPQRASIE